MEFLTKEFPFLSEDHLPFFDTNLLSTILFAAAAAVAAAGIRKAS